MLGGVKITLSALVGSLVSCFVALFTDNPIFLVGLLSFILGAVISLILYGVLGDSRRRKQIKELSESLEATKTSNNKLREKLKTAGIMSDDGLGQWRKNQ